MTVPECTTSCAIIDPAVCDFCQHIPKINYEKSLNVVETTSLVQGCLFNDEDNFLAYLASLCRSGNRAIVEIGSYYGKSTVALALGSISGPKIPVFTFDDYSGGAFMEGVDVFDKLVSNLQTCGVSDFVKPSKMSSKEAAKEFDLDVELLFIDGDHAYDACRNDYLNWCDKVVPGGRIAFHDCMDLIRGSIRFEGPIRVVYDFCKDNLYYEIEGRYGSIVVVKVKELEQGEEDNVQPRDGSCTDVQSIEQTKSVFRSYFEKFTNFLRHSGSQ